MSPRESLTLGDTDLRELTPAQAHEVRGDRISMIFQDPQTSLNPLMTIEDQLVETIQAHSDASKTEPADAPLISSKISEFKTHPNG